jgi:hypothetical protein
MVLLLIEIEILTYLFRVDGHLFFFLFFIVFVFFFNFFSFLLLLFDLLVLCLINLTHVLRNLLHEELSRTMSRIKLVEVTA